MFVFGYASLIWRQGFPYEERICGCIKGFKRRFWQGSEDHRGRPGHPGRVASVCKSEDPEDRVYGVAFRIQTKDEEWVRSYLVDRETGYDSIKTLFYPSTDGREITQTSNNHGGATLTSNNPGETTLTSSEPIELEIFLANKNMDTWLGPASEKEIAWQIYHAQGLGGPNIEYLMKLIWCNRNLFPGNIDEHLDKLELESQEIAKVKSDDLTQYTNQKFI